jgi:hypothetical protein
MTCINVFKLSVEAIRRGELIQRVSQSDKEFHFQNWFQARLAETGLQLESGGRNSYPDFRMVASTEGFEIKGLAYPGRDASFDSNSQVPTGEHNGRTIYYVFGRYPKDPDGNAYPVVDLVVCHGDFLNATRDYVHKNKSVKAFGSYGDLLIRDRKMYVVPTPFRLVDGVAHSQTLILPAEIEPGSGFIEVGQLTRVEAAEMVVAYTFNLQTNELIPAKVANPHAGTEHRFRAWRAAGTPGNAVCLRAVNPEELETEAIDANEDNS